MKLIYLLLTTVFLAPLGGLTAAPVRTEHVEAELVAEVTTIQPGRPFRVGVRLAMDDHWHVYWRNPGDAGLPTDISWDLPEGFKAGDIQWPYPGRFMVEDVANFGYEGEVLLLVEITPPDGLSPGTEITLAAEVSWLVCMEACIPGDARVEHVVTVQAGNPVADPAQAARFAEARTLLPVKPAGLDISASKEEGAFVIEIRSDADLPGNVFYFPYEEGLIDYSAEQALVATDGSLQLTVSRSEADPGDPDAISGILVADQAWPGGTARAVEGQWSFGKPDTPDALTAAGTSPEEPPKMGLLQALLYGLLGGMILNLMPCVFPVISLKIMGFVDAAHGSRGKAIEHALVFAAGILVSFWVLAAVMIGIKMGGQEIGWAFQFQEPGFVMFMALLFTLITLNMFGVFEIGTGMGGVGSGLTEKSGWGGSFFSGILATLVATPCTGPFMAPVLGWALSQPGWVIFLILTALGMGMAMPYVLLSSSPALMKRVPRPGPWMESFKQFLGFVLLAFAIIMVWVLGKQTDLRAVTMLLLGLYLVSMGAWVLGRWGAIHRSPRTRWLGRLVAVLLMVGGTVYALSYQPPLGADALDADRLAALKASGEPVHYADFSPEAADILIDEGVSVLWQPWTPDRIAALRDAGQPVFVDFTAAWCMICQANKKAMHAGAVEQAFAEAGVTALEADWTKRDELIRKELERFGRSGVPLYLLYPAGGGEPVVLPQNLTAGILLGALSQADLR